MNISVLPSLTTLSKLHSNWQSKIVEIENSRLKEFALFLTGLSEQERPQLYAELFELRKSIEFKIPFIHATSTMAEWEFSMFRELFNTQAFNLHPLKQYPLKYKLSPEIRKHIYIENSSAHDGLGLEDVFGFAGLCIDLSHLEDSRINSPQSFDRICSLLEKFPVGANHISAVLPFTSHHNQEGKHNSHHYAYSPREFNYLRGLPQKAFGPIAAIEVENPIREQCLFADHINSLISETTHNSESIAA